MASGCCCCGTLFLFHFSGNRINELAGERRKLANLYSRAVIYARETDDLTLDLMSSTRLRIDRAIKARAIKSQSIAKWRHITKKASAFQKRAIHYTGGRPMLK